MNNQFSSGPKQNAQQKNLLSSFSKILFNLNKPLFIGSGNIRIEKGVVLVIVFLLMLESNVFFFPYISEVEGVFTAVFLGLGWVLARDHAMKPLLPWIGGILCTGFIWHLSNYFI